eukprot:scaffold10643_cov151-Amphora_coffeaeformis.AAC.6
MSGGGTALTHNHELFHDRSKIAEHDKRTIVASFLRNNIELTLFSSMIIMARWCLVCFVDEY